MSSINAVRDQEAGFDFWRVTFEIQFAPTWILDVLDAGKFTMIYDANGDPAGAQPIREVLGKDIPEPLMLDGEGRILNGDGRYTPWVPGRTLNQNNKPIYRRYSIYNTRPFAPLNLF